MDISQAVSRIQSSLPNISAIDAVHYTSTAIVASVTLYKLGNLLYWYILRGRTDLHKRYGKNGWCVVTGASSGIGAAFAFQLAAKYDYKVIMVARREAQLNDMENKIKKENPNAVVKIVQYDLSNLGTEQEEYGAKFVSKVSDIVKDEGVSIVVHMAGNSDLAWHLTDKTAQRNCEVMNLCVTSTLVLVQGLIPLLIKRRLQSPEYRTAFITSGAMTAFISSPTFTCSSANKHYVRALTRAAALEYESNGIDFMCAHPIAVLSEIVKIPIPSCITADQFVHGVLGDLGQTYESTGWRQHDTMVYSVSVLPPSYLKKRQYGRAPFVSQFLKRPIDTRPLEVKLGLVKE